jgi:hypothetical protein
LLVSFSFRLFRLFSFHQKRHLNLIQSQLKGGQSDSINSVPSSVIQLNSQNTKKIEEIQRQKAEITIPEFRTVPWVGKIPNTKYLVIEKIPGDPGSSGSGSDDSTIADLEFWNAMKYDVKPQLSHVPPGNKKNEQCEVDDSDSDSDDDIYTYLDQIKSNTQINSISRPTLESISPGGFISVPIPVPNAKEQIMRLNAAQKDQSPSSTSVLTKIEMKKYPTIERPPREIFDSYTNNTVKLNVKNAEWDKNLFAHGYEAGIIGLEDLVECPLQLGKGYQRVKCSKITEKNKDLFIFGLETHIKSTEPGMARFIAPPPYYDTEQAIQYLNEITGDCYYFHLNGKFWGYIKYEPEQILNKRNYAQNINNSWERPTINSSSNPTE